MREMIVLDITITNVRAPFRSRFQPRSQLTLDDLESLTCIALRLGLADAQDRRQSGAHCRGHLGPGLGVRFTEVMTTLRVADQGVGDSKIPEKLRTHGARERPPRFRGDILSSDLYRAPAVRRLSRYNTSRQRIFSLPTISITKD